MEDVWLTRFPGEDSSVHLVDFPETPADWLDEPLAAKWARVREVRKVVTGALELARRDKVIGSSLEASPVVFLGTAKALWSSDEEALLELQSIDFAEVCITSGIEIRTGTPSEAYRLESTPGITVVFEKATGEKCQRCWKILPDVGTHQHPGVCGRCDAVLQGA